MHQLTEEARGWAHGDSDTQWLEAIPFAGADGNYLALHDGRVVFLHHEGDRELGHGRVLAPDLRTFVERWTALGCPDASSWDCLSYFVTDDGLTVDDEPARRWIAWLQDVAARDDAGLPVDDES
ncbi:hypothetical protein [Paraliomyxa miuraensis]|uniref:hypothetical protein n=1 Tax=Paraliomyxa miuraensis TaxID=376150 RepID=UPI002255659C|nr:hypothetical protein [Paraliomyxa miuraensis]MCX4246513.1 hypothetical protein [Paraliomyxa miuraensis]